MKILTGLITATSGLARLFELPAGSNAARRRLGYLPEHHRFPEYLTGAQVLEYYGKLSGMSRGEVLSRQDAVLELVGMRDWADTKVKEYSKGMAQRVGLAQALIHDPELVFLDEPTDGVDPVGRREIRDVLKRLAAEGKTVFINSHLLQEVELICGRVAIMSHGQVVKCGTVQEITKTEARVTLQISKPIPEKLQDRIDKLFSDKINSQSQPNGTTVFVVPGNDQGKIDQVVDEIRKAELSILAITPEKLSLEDAFLEVVGGRQVGASPVKAKAIKP
jgi:ABC-2 type transport system ATP-binding protein